MSHMITLPLLLVAAYFNACPEITQPLPLDNDAACDSAMDDDAWIETDGMGKWLVVWSSNNTLDGTPGSDRDVFLAWSTDNGAVWTNPMILNSNAATDIGDEFRPVPATDGAGNWVVVWFSDDDLGDTIGDDYDILFSRSSDDGSTWTAPAALNTNASFDSGGDYVPRLVTDRAGHWIVVWYSNESFDGMLGDDFDLLISHSFDEGDTWTSPQPLNVDAPFDTEQDFIPWLASDEMGNWLVVWYVDDNCGGPLCIDADIMFSRSADDGMNWTAPAYLNSNAADDVAYDQFPTVATDGAGTWLAIWHSDAGSDYDIFVSRSTDFGTNWTTPEPLNSNAGFDSGDDIAPQIITDRHGNWIASWRNDDLDGMLGIDSDDFFSLSTDQGTSWSTPQPFNTNAGVDSGTDWNVRLANDRATHWAGVWWSEDDLGGTIGTDRDILVARFVLTSNDCNDNATPDECDLADGTSEDANKNGIPDECDQCLDGSMCMSGEVCLDGNCVPDPACTDDDGDGKVTICHVPPGNPDNPHTISVSVNALPAHQAHGDSCGPCGGDGGVILVEAESESCQTDMNGDHVIDASDLAQLLGGWGSSPDHPGDLDGDAVVNAFDLALLLGSWGACP